MLQVLANGLVSGAILALTALSVTVIFSILRVPNFGLGGLFVWGGQPRWILVEGLDFVVSVGGAVYLPASRLVILLVVGLAFLGLHLYVTRTRVGRAMRAVAQDRMAASLLGIPIDRIAAATFALGSALAGLAGGLFGATFNFTPHVGSWSILMAFVAVVLGGLGSVPGAILGALLLGLLDSVMATYVSSAYKETLAFLILIAVLIARPSGLLGERTARAEAVSAA